MPTVRANGIDIGYEVHGAGPPVVLLHGATSAGREDFAAQAPLLSRAFLVHLPDARGHATTRWDAGNGFEYAWLVDDLLAFADALGLRTFHLVGFSMGAMTALQFAVRHPERLRTLVVIGITPNHEPRASVARRLMDPVRVDRDDPAWAAELSRRHDPVQGPGAWRRLLPAIVADLVAQPSLTPRELHGIDCPTLVVAGDRDPFVPVDHAWGLARLLPQGRLLIVPDCGHEVMVRRPAIFNEALASFYRSTEGVARRRAAEPLIAAAAAGAGPVEREDAASLRHPDADAVPDIHATDAHWLEAVEPRRTAER